MHDECSSVHTFLGPLDESCVWHAAGPGRVDVSIWVEDRREV